MLLTAPAPAAPKKKPALAKRLHTRVLSALTRGSKTNVDMTLFRYLFEGQPALAEEEEGEKKGDPQLPPFGASCFPAASPPPPPLPAYAPARVLKALAPVRSLTVAQGWQRSVARKAIEHPRLGAPGVVHFVVARTRWFDAQVAAALGGDPPSGGGNGNSKSSSSSSTGAPRQVVALAAGYEMRAHRLAASGKLSPAGEGVTFFEVDLPHASALKRELVDKLGLAPRPPSASSAAAIASPSAAAASSSATAPPPAAAADVRYVPADLSWPGALRQKLVAAGFDPSKPAVFTAEGLLYYLHDHASAALLNEVAELMAEADASAAAAAAVGADGAAAAAAASARVAGASRLVLDYLHSDALAAGLARGIGGGGGAGGKQQQQQQQQRKGGGRTAKKAKKAAAAAAAAAPRMPRAYEVTARSVASKGEPFVSGAGAQPLEAAAWLSSATGGLLSLRSHRPMQQAADEVLPPSCKGAPVLSFYSFLTAEVAAAPPPTGTTLTGGSDVIARLA